MSRQIITQGGKPAFVVIPIEEWRRIEATLEATLGDRTDAAAVRAFLKNPTETFPDAVVSAILGGTPPLKALREHRLQHQRSNHAPRCQRTFRRGLR